MAPLTLLSPTPSLTLFHDPASTRSEYALQELQLGCQTFDVRRVTFAGGKLAASELRDVTSRLVADAPDALVKRGPRYDALGLDLDGADAEVVISTLGKHPELLATPILDDGTATMVGNTLERIEAWAVTGHVVDARPTFSFPAIRLDEAA